MKINRKQRLLPYLLLFMTLLGSVHHQAQTFTGEGDWKSPERWDTGSVPGDNAITIINGVAEVSENIGVNNADNPSRIIIGQETEGRVHVTGGTLSGANGGGAGIFVGAGPGGEGYLHIAQGTGFRSQGGNMVVQVGDEEGGRGFVSVAGELLNYKYFRIVNGTLEMLPTGINNRFNQLDTLSTIEPDGVLSYVIDGDQVGTLARANANGLNVDIFPGANLKLTLEGDFEVNDSWVLMRYHTLVGAFEQGTSYTNQQGYTFELDYGSGEDSELIATLVSTAARPTIHAFAASPSGITLGASTTLTWEVGSFDQLTIEPGIGNVNGSTTNGKGQVEVSPTQTTTYELKLEKGGASLSAKVIIVVDQAPIIGQFNVSPTIIEPNGSALLEWVVDGADTILIEPSPGEVDPSGSQSISPAESTRYRLTATNANGSSTSEVDLTVDAITAALQLSFDAAAPNQVNGALFDVLTGASFDLKTAQVDTQLETFSTRLTAAYRLNQFGGNSGGDGNAFPGGTTTYEAWVRTGPLESQPQVIFENGNSSDGSCLLISEKEVTYLNSSGGERTHDLRVPLSGLSLTDFLQISVSVDADNETIVMTLKAAAGGEASNQSQGLVGLPNGRASLFNWTNFSAAPSGALGGIGTEVPEGVTLFQGELALLNIYRRALSADEIQELFDRTTLPDPGLITAFSASPQRIQSGDMVRLSWSVNPHETLTLKTPSGNIDLRDMDHLELTPTVSSAFTLIAEGPEGASARSVLVWVDIAEDAVILTESSDDWNQPGAWADGQSPSSAKDYVVTDFMASSLGVPGDFDARFGGGSLELMGMGSRLRIANDLTDQITIPRFKLSGGTVDYTAEEGSVTVEGSWEVLRESLIDIRGTYNAMYLNASISGDADLRFWANPTDLASDETLILTGDLSAWQGGLILEGGRTYADTSGGIGHGDLLLINANLEVNQAINNPEGSVELRQNSHLILFAQATMRALNIRQSDGSAIAIPAGTYNVSSWTTTAEGLGIDPLQVDLMGGAELTLLETIGLPTQGSVFTGQGLWKSASNWSEGIPTDGSNAIVNGSAEINENIGSSNADNPSRIFVGDNATGSLRVTGGTLSGAHSGNNAGLFVGRGPSGMGEILIEPGAALRSQGGGMVVQLGDESGGRGDIVVGGELFNYKFFRILNGTLTMLSTGSNRSFNSTDTSTIGSQGTLAFHIDGDQVGSLLRSNASGLNLVIDPGAHLEVQLSGSVNESDSWVLMDYTTLSGTFAEGTRFTNAQGHTFELDYGSGDNDLLTVTLVTLNPEAAEPTLSLQPSPDGWVLDYTGQLVSSTEVQGDYQPVPGASSPYLLTPGEPQRFYRAVR